MRKTIISISRYIVLAAILVFGVWYVTVNYERFATGARFTAGNISLLLALNLLTILFESIRLRLQVKKLGYTLGIVDSWHIMTVLQAANHVVLKAGTFSAGYYMSKRYRISFNSYCAFVITYVVIMVLGSGAFGFVVSLGYMAAGTGVDIMLPVFFLFIIACCTAVISLASLRVNLDRLPRIINRFITAWKEIYSDYNLIISMIGVEILYALSCALRFMVAVRMFSIHMDFLSCVVVVTIGNFLRVASIVPGGLGIAEIGSGWTAAIMGGDAGVSGLSAGLDRLAYVILVMVFGGVGFLTLSGRSEFHKPPEDTPDSNIQASTG